MSDFKSDLVTDNVSGMGVSERVNLSITDISKNEKLSPKIIIFGGVNGAGKTSLYEVMSRTENLGKRISVDEIVAAEGSWKDPIIQIRAAKLAKKLIDRYIENKESFHFESTLTGKVVLRQLEKARENGFSVTLYFVGVDGIDTAIERVERRVKNGGHGIDTKAIITRYNAMKENLRRILGACDEIYFYDNTARFRQIAIHKSGKILDEDPILPEWYLDTFR